MSATTELVARGVLAWLKHRPFSKETRERHKAKRAARKAARSGEIVSQPDEVSMNSAILTQIVLAVLRHAMTALAPLGVTVSDDWLVQTAAIVVGLIGLAWSFKRKAKPAE